MPPPSLRWSMWACLFGVAFKKVPGAEKAFLESRVSPEMFAEHVELSRGSCGGAPHPQQVWGSIMSALAE